VRVLIADNQKDVGLILAALVERCGHEVLQIVTSGLEAIQAYTRLRPDAVLMDYAMPRLNGATASRMILAKHPDVKIILISSATPAVPLTPSAAIAILPKPVRLAQLYGALRRRIATTRPLDSLEVNP